LSVDDHLGADAAILEGAADLGAQHVGREVRLSQAVAQEAAHESLAGAVARSRRRLVAVACAAVDWVGRPDDVEPRPKGPILNRLGSGLGPDDEPAEPESRLA